MKEMYMHCTKYDKWKKREEFTQIPIINSKCEDPRRVSCNLCEFNKTQWVEEE